MDLVLAFRSDSGSVGLWLLTDWVLSLGLSIDELGYDTVLALVRWVISVICGYLVV
jgi:hypothetical protein